ncbi:MAG: hypothetical protein P8P74_08110 [Crocinitomicaceae bacterium]|nr:hypothetical protein [Crocinitomicaceae bacterium]
MKIAFAAILILICHVSVGQVRAFNKRAKELIETKDSIQDIEEEAPSSEYYAFLSEGSDALNALFMSETKSMARSKPDELTKSQTLMSLAELATDAWKGTQYADRKKWKALSKHFHRAFNRSTSKFNYTKEISFRVKLVNNHGKKFYCDKKPGICEFNLYAGKKPTGLTKEEKENLPDPTPLDYFTEQQLVDQFWRQMRRNKIIKDLKRGRYACVGVNVEVDERTLNRKRIPTARVVIIFGARRLREIRIKKTEMKSTT